MANINMRKLDNCKLQITLNITKELRFRLWLAKLLVALMGWILTGSKGDLVTCSSMDSSSVDKATPVDESLRSTDKASQMQQAPKESDNHWKQVNPELWKDMLQPPNWKDGVKVIPVPMLLFCPKCNLQHVDEPHGAWRNPPHRSHLCDYCGYIWRPSDAATTGVLSLMTAGKRDGIARPDIEHTSRSERT